MAEIFYFLVAALASALVFYGAALLLFSLGVWGMSIYFGGAMLGWEEAFGLSTENSDALLKDSAALLVVALIATALVGVGATLGHVCWRFALEPAAGGSPLAVYAGVFFGVAAPGVFFTLALLKRR